MADAEIIVEHVVTTGGLGSGSTKGGGTSCRKVLVEVILAAKGVAEALAEAGTAVVAVVATEATEKAAAIVAEYKQIQWHW